MTASSRSKVIRLSDRATLLSLEEFEAAVQAEHARHVAALAALIGGYAGGRTGDHQGVPAAAQDKVLSLAMAAHEIGWSEQRLRSAIVRQSKLPPQHRFAWQPGGVRNAPWHIDMNRLWRYVRDLPPNAR